MADLIKITHLSTWINTNTADTTTACPNSRVDTQTMAMASHTVITQRQSVMRLSLITITPRAVVIKITSK